MAKMIRGGAEYREWLKENVEAYRRGGAELQISDVLMQSMPLETGGLVEIVITRPDGTVDRLSGRVMEGERIILAAGKFQ